MSARARLAAKRERRFGMGRVFHSAAHAGHPDLATPAATAVRVGGTHRLAHGLRDRLLYTPRPAHHGRCNRGRRRSEGILMDIRNFFPVHDED